MKSFSSFVVVVLALLQGTENKVPSTFLTETDTEEFQNELTERLDAVGSKLRAREGQDVGSKWAQWYNWGNWANGWNNWRNW